MAAQRAAIGVAVLGRLRHHCCMTLARIVLLVLILLVILIVPPLLLKDRDRKAKEVDAAERAISTPRAASAAPAVDPDRVGLTFGWFSTDQPDRLYAGCRGHPRLPAAPPRDGCNPYQGDTSCRTVLPVLCQRDAPQSAGFALGTARPVPGFALARREDGDAHCRAEFGSDWSMASYPWGQDAGMLSAARTVGLTVDASQRAWVASSNPRANCWQLR
jgi:hypothetical protein